MSGVAIVIRELEERDEMWIGDEWVKSQHDHFGQYPHILEETITYSQNAHRVDFVNMMDKWKPPNVFFVAEDTDGNPMGTIGVKHKGEEADLCRLFTLVSQRSKGASKLLIDAAEAWIKENNYKRIILETTAFQPRAANMYLARGYFVARVEA